MDRESVFVKRLSYVIFHNFWLGGRALTNAPQLVWYVVSQCQLMVGVFRMWFPVFGAVGEGKHKVQ